MKLAILNTLLLINTQIIIPQNNLEQIQIIPLEDQRNWFEDELLEDDETKEDENEINFV
jgi:hypothetical protein